MNKKKAEGYGDEASRRVQSKRVTRVMGSVKTFAAESSAVALTTLIALPLATSLILAVVVRLALAAAMRQPAARADWSFRCLVSARR